MLHRRRELFTHVCVMPNISVIPANAATSIRNFLMEEICRNRYACQHQHTSVKRNFPLLYWKSRPASVIYLFFSKLNSETFISQLVVHTDGERGAVSDENHDLN